MFFASLKHSGFTILELLVAISIMSFLLLLSAPSFGTWMNSVRLRTQIESSLLAIMQAKGEAIRQNDSIVFHMDNTNNQWFVCRQSVLEDNDLCFNGTTDLSIARSNGVNYLSPVNFLDTNTTAIRQLTFNGLGSVGPNTSGVARLTQMRFSHKTGVTGVKPLLLSIPNGTPYICDPSVNDSTDDRFCRN